MNRTLAMNAQSKAGPDELNKIIELIHGLEARVARLEKRIDLADGKESSVESETLPITAFRERGAKQSREEVSLEFKIGEYWLAHIGTVVLLTGIAFFISYPFKMFPAIVTSFIGYLAVGAIFALSRYWQETYQYLSRILYSGGLVLLYFATVRLHFFNPQPVLDSKVAGLTAVVVVLVVIFYLATKRQSELLTGIALFLCYITSLLSDTSHFALILTTATSAAAVYVAVRYKWQRILVSAMVLAYLVHLIWLLNDPVLGKPMQAISEHHNNLLYLFCYGVIFAWGGLVLNRRLRSDFYEFLLAAINSVGFFVLGSLVALTYFQDRLAQMNIWFALFFMAAAVVNWVVQQNKYSSAIYACFGNLVLSIAIFAQFKSPDFFIWLGWQSLLVISMAIWFHSRIIVLVNALIYSGIFLGYLYLAPSDDFVNLSYAIVALASARILNWKKERLELKTDMIRNAYLVSAFVIVLYGLYHAVPGHYVSLSWLGAALFYFGMSLLLGNIKYRWMAILSIFATIVHVVLIDMAQLSAEFRIFLFVAVGLVLLGVSLLYTRFRKKTAGTGVP